MAKAVGFFVLISAIVPVENFILQKNLFKVSLSGNFYYICIVEKRKKQRKIIFYRATLTTSMKTKKSNILTLDQFKDKHYGKKGTAKRDNLEAGYENFKVGALVYEARLERGLTQKELAERVGTTKSYISKIENNLKEARISTLQKIIELGLGGHLELSIKL